MRNKIEQELVELAERINKVVKDLDIYHNEQRKDITEKLDVITICLESFDKRLDDLEKIFKG